MLEQSERGSASKHRATPPATATTAPISRHRPLNSPPIHHERFQKRVLRTCGQILPLHRVRSAKYFRGYGARARRKRAGTAPVLASTNSKKPPASAVIVCDVAHA